jgi:hypothetical protein
MFLAPPDSDQLIRGMDPDPNPDPNPSTILLSSSKNNKKNLDSFCFVTSFGLFISGSGSTPKCHGSGTLDFTQLTVGFLLCLYNLFRNLTTLPSMSKERKLGGRSAAGRNCR